MESPTIAVTDLSVVEQRGLLALARGAVEAELRGAGEAQPAPIAAALRELRGAFVTLRRGMELRGCIGHVAADRPLVDVVACIAVSAATADPRFPPVTREELIHLRIEISVLSEPVPLVSRDPARLQIGQDGVIVRRGWRQGLLLPQVAVEYGWDAEALLAATCRKAGLSADAWRETNTEIHVFQVDVFGE